ncbi:MAG: acetylglutamate kinase [Chloroflexi bacterium]|nr:acetylglutamate kinase [Chloroflexota bacterium]
MPTQPDTPAAADASARLGALVESLPHLASLVGKRIVLKIGGSIEGEGTLLQDVALLQRLGVQPVIVHGGGPAITDLARRLGLETRFVQGRRYTDEATLDCARMVLVGKINGDIVAELHRLGARAFGLNGLDGRLIRARLRDPELGLVGEVEDFDLAPLELLIERGYIGVMAPVASGPNGEPLNINADSVAGDLARALSAEKLVLFTDVPGVLDADQQLIREISEQRVRWMIEDGTISGGMIPKVEACLRALETVPRVHILDGRTPHALVEELLTDVGIGTMMVAG